MTISDFLNSNKAAKNLSGRNLVVMDDFSTEEINAVLDIASLMKSGEISRKEQTNTLTGFTLAEIFEKPSLRTRVSFETGIYQLGGQGIYISPSEIGLGVRESVYDVASVLCRMTNMIMARTFKHSTVKELAETSKVPVINGLCDMEHPCQALADILTVKECKGSVKNLNFTYVGDGNNVCHSLMIICAKLRINFTAGCPEGYFPEESYIKRAAELAKENGCSSKIETDPVKAVTNADVVYTDVWTSMGQEEESKQREKDFAEYQVNERLMSHAKSDAIFLHCLPAHRGYEVSAGVIDSPQSVVFQEAENRLHAQKAVMALLGYKSS